LVGMERERYLAMKFGWPQRAASIYGAVAGAGHSERIPFDFEKIRCMPNTIKSHRLVCYADRFGIQDTMVEALFRAFFFEGDNIGEDETLLRVAVLVGLEREATATFLASEDERDTVLAEDLRARRMGISAVPYYLVNGDYGISGAQDSEAFFPLFDLARNALVAE
ncbi:MAG TPA: DsbA family oxidoreductase, partial [Rhodospirillaceae bacterium]|nr:DsbA family oxidoreductase [Rhodospirillaceae bacterium]